MLQQTIEHHFPDMIERLSQVDDPRKAFGATYRIEEILFAAIFMSAARIDSRNRLNQFADESFRKSFFKLFGLGLPHMDTVSLVLEQMNTDELNTIKDHLIITLVRKKVLAPARVGGLYVVAVDATHVQNVKSEAEGTTTQTSSGGKTTNKRSVLEMKIVAWGMSLSLGSEWIFNHGKTEQDKQDSEIAAFKRLSARVKMAFPRLPILIVADGLYAGAPFFSLCTAHLWQFFVVFKDGKISTVWDKVDVALEERDEESIATASIWETTTAGHSFVEQTIEWINEVDYRGHSLAWVEQRVGESRFVHLSSIAINHSNARQLCAAGRSRWLIEDSFNTQKNRGSGLGHQFSRRSWVATKNYYQALQIGRILAQLVEHSKRFRDLKGQSESIKALWQIAVSALIFLSEGDFQQTYQRTRISYRH